jgi:hypothetical protein
MSTTDKPTSKPLSDDDIKTIDSVSKLVGNAEGALCTYLKTASGIAKSFETTLCPNGAKGGGSGASAAVCSVLAPVVANHKALINGQAHNNGTGVGSFKPASGPC